MKFSSCNRYRHLHLFLWLLVILGASRRCTAWITGQVPKQVSVCVSMPRITHTNPKRIFHTTVKRTSATRLARLETTALCNDKYSREVILREEAESPFRKVRFFIYLSLAGGAATSFAVSLARIAAGLNGINADLLDESLVNAGVDVVGLAVLALAYQRDLKAQESRYKRATKGAELAKLMVRLRTNANADSTSDGKAQGQTSATTTLASFRRGRGIEKRVVIAVAGKQKIEKLMQEAKLMQDDLDLNDLVIVPLVLPQLTAPVVTDQGEQEIPICVALPVGNGWKSVIGDEVEQAEKQGIDMEDDGICIILKKNGRVGQRTKGIFLNNLVLDVSSRRDLGMDIANI